LLAHIARVERVVSPTFLASERFESHTTVSLYVDL
jgi:hypothetical protein